MGIGLHYIPLAMFVLTPVLFAITYVIAVQLEHINPVYAYISDTGTMPPEMCIFGMGLSILMILGVLLSYIRYKQVDGFLHGKGQTWCRRTESLNKAGLYFGLITSFGIGIVGSFQETSALIVHIFGAALTFFGGSVFFIIQGFLTKTMSPHFGSKRLAYTRIIIGVTCAVLYLICQVSGAIALHSFTGDHEDLIKWERHHGDWNLRITSVVSEWIMFGFFQLYFLTFVPEFKKLTFVPPQIVLTPQKEEDTPADADLSRGDEGLSKPKVSHTNTDHVSDTGSLSKEQPIETIGPFP